MSELIRRDDAIDAIKQVTIHSEDESLAVEALENLPPAEREKGSWINEPYEAGLYVHRCSNCLKASGIGGGDLWFNFCPNCGADMRGEEDE